MFNFSTFDDTFEGRVGTLDALRIGQSCVWMSTWRLDSDGKGSISSCATLWYGQNHHVFNMFFLNIVYNKLGNQLFRLGHSQ